MWLIWGMMVGFANAGALDVEIKANNSKPSHFVMEGISLCYDQAFEFTDPNGVKNDVHVWVRPVKNSELISVRVNVERDTKGLVVGASPVFTLTNGQRGRLVTDEYAITVKANDFVGEQACEYLSLIHI